jgi:hypothetical protein
MPSHDVSALVQYGTYACAHHSIYVVQTLLIFGKYHTTVVNTVSLSIRDTILLRILFTGKDNLLIIDDAKTKLSPRATNK